MEPAALHGGVILFGLVHCGMISSKHLALIGCA